MNPKLTLTLFAALTLAACGKDPAAAPASGTHTHADGTVHQNEPPAASDHGTPHPLGNLTLGAHTFAVIQEGEVVADHEAAFDLEFPVGKELPGTVRAWIGIESGQGSRKGLLAERENERIVHGHVEVPKVIPEGSKVWIEIEANGTTQRGSLAWHR